MKRLLFIVTSLCLIGVTVVAQLTGPLKMTSAQGNFSQYLSRSAVKNTTEQNEATTSFNNMENTKGERFLFDNWVSGSNVSNTQNELINTTSYLFNFDKLTGSLLATENKADILSVSPSGINSFMLENRGKQYLFVHVAAIDSNTFFLKLTGVDSLYSLYKECKVKLVKSNYHNDGMIQTGNPYDEYIDESVYNITKPNSSTSRIITLKTRDMKNVLVAEKEKVNAYLNQHKNDLINENFLIGLINYVNQYAK